LSAPPAMTSFSAQLEELRSRAQDTLSTGGSAQDVKPIVQAMASVPLPLCAKYCHIRAESMVKENSTGNTREEKLFTALSILEKYGLNLTSSNKPRYWRSVKHNNPVFKATVDSVKGGREVLCLYGYSNQQPDGLCFPDDVMDPDVEGVAAVTLEIMTLLLLLCVSASGLTVVTTLLQGDSELVSDAQVIPKSGGVPEVEAQPLSSSIPLKQAPSPETTPTTPAPKAETDNCTICGIFPVFAHCPTCVQRLCGECDKLYHSHPERRGHDRITVTPARVQRTTRPSVSSWECSYCTTVNGVQAVLCETCDRPRLAGTTPPVPEESLQLSTVAEWQCKSCTVMNAGLSVLCEVCERPRLATRPPATPVRPAPTTPSLLQDSGTQVGWTCQVCTFANSIPAGACEMCSSPRADYTPKPPAPGSQRSEKPFMKTPVPAVENPDVKRQRLMKEEGLKLIQQIREAEKKGVTPEEVYAALQISKGSNVKPCDWLNSELPHLLDEIYAAIPRSGVQVSRAEAKQAWLATGGDIEKAVVQVLRDRKSKLQELFSLGFREAEKCEEALRLSGGEVRGALSILQRPQLEAFHKRVWSDQPEPGIDIHDPDRQRLCRRLLALYDLPSWGRCELALSLLQEPDAQYSLEDVVQAVRESHDRDFIRRVLAKECPCCLCVFPHSKMQSLTSCQCSVCCGCFQQHFTIAIRDKHIRDMVCPACGGPDINDPDYLNSYFSTLDIQLRDCLEPEVYDLFHKKLTEHALIKDPKFLWCCHCSFGFIYDGDQLKVTCLQCQKSFCAKCKKPWESQHAGLSCEQFQAWKRENDPEYQKQGLAGYLRDNGITCPNCRFQYALTKGGCMHFTCSQCRYQFCSGCNNPFHTTCNQCSVTGLHAHHPRDCLFYLRDWEPKQLQALLQKNGVEFNTEPPHGAQPGMSSVLYKGGSAKKHYKEYLVSLINGHSLDPALLFDLNNLVIACRRYQVDSRRLDTEDETTYSARLLKKLMDEVLLGDKVPRKK
uniref:Ring finger protein 31 n=1 Tax=Scleropages formosus TaxID=113540 RepID=A0A8C9W943_SCLFO